MTGPQKQIGLPRAHLSLYIINSPAGRVGAGPTVGLVHFLNAAVHLIFHLHRKKEFGSSKGILVGAVSVSAPAKIPKRHMCKVAGDLCKLLTRKSFSLHASVQIQVKSQVFYSTWSKHSRTDCGQEGRLTIHSKGRVQFSSN